MFLKDHGIDNFEYTREGLDGCVERNRLLLGANTRLAKESSAIQSQINKSNEDLARAIGDFEREGADMLLGNLHCIYRFVEEAAQQGVSMPRIIFRFCKAHPDLAYNRLIDKVMTDSPEFTPAWVNTMGNSFVQSLFAYRSEAKKHQGEESFLKAWEMGQ